MFKWLNKRASRCHTLEDWLLSHFEALPREVSGRELSQHFAVMLKAYGQSPESSLQILDVAAKVFVLEMVEAESHTATKH
jgi:hypothetical protein